ncbi:MAG: AbrB/MazE/SpoVT family DNA-binding domain-containing protein [Nitrospinae bacterium]|nr:AbrB/MazE/SpoVT family DNA-binding domain-containing protein [Nitrospinota bacterium]
MLDLKIRKIGNARGVILPREVLDKLRVKDGDKLYLTEAPDGSYRITPYDPEFEKQMTLAKKTMSRYRNTLRELSK